MIEARATSELRFHIALVKSEESENPQTRLYFHQHYNFEITGRWKKNLLFWELYSQWWLVVVEEEEKISLKMTPKMMKVDVAGVCDGSGCISH